MHPHLAHISVLQVKYFLSYKRINNFLNQKSSSFYVFLCLNSRSRDLESPKLAHMTLLLIFILSPNFKFLRVSVCQFLNKSILICHNSRTKTMVGYYAFTQSLNNIRVIFKLPAASEYQPNLTQTTPRNMNAIYRYFYSENAI